MRANKPVKKLLLVTSNYWPENTGIGVYSTDLAENAFTQACEVQVLTGLPHYPWWKTPEEYKDLIPGSYEHNGVHVERVNHLIPVSPGALGRAQLEFSFWRHARKALRVMNSSEYDRVVAIVPTVAAALAARRFASRLNIPFYVIFQDISSAGARESGMPGAKWLGKMSEYLERRAIKGTKGIAIVSPAMSKPVRKLNSSNTPMTVIPNYSLRTASTISKREGRARLGFPENEFIFLHTGNMGFKQDLLNLVTAGNAVTRDAARIYIVGHGNQEAVIRGAILVGGNVTWLPSVADEEYPYLLAAADVLLVNERATQIAMSLPSKATSYLSSNRAILAAVPAGGASAKYLANVAYLVPAGEPAQLAAAMDELISSPEIGLQLATQGLQKFHDELSKDVAYAAYLKWLGC